MDALIVIAPILGATLMGAISPGPSFVLVARTAIAVSRLDGLVAALGMGLGAAFFAAAALAGLQALLANVPSVYLAVKLIGAIYLLYLAGRLWRGAHETIDQGAAAAAVPSLLRSFFIGLGTQLSNPKTAIIYASIFAALLPPSQTWASASLIVFLIFAIEAGWYALVAIAFSAERPRRHYLRSKVWLDRTAGAVIGLLGLKIISDLR